MAQVSGRGERWIPGFWTEKLKWTDGDAIYQVLEEAGRTKPKQYLEILPEKFPNTLMKCRIKNKKPTGRPIITKLMENKE